MVFIIDEKHYCSILDDILLPQCIHEITPASDQLEQSVGTVLSHNHAKTQIHKLAQYLIDLAAI